MPAEKAGFQTPKRPKLSTGNVSTPSSTGASPGGSGGSFEIPATPLLKRLGFGTGVNVMLYERSPRNGVARSPWALKKLREKSKNSGNFVSLRLESEAEVLKKLNHPNIIGYRGFKRQADGSLVLAVENGQKALYDIIDESRDESSESPKPLSAEKILKVVRGVASGLHYLHTKHKLLHGDVKSGNVLVIGDFEEVKLCDFGVTVPIDDDLKCPENSKITYAGTDPWSAKEAIEGDQCSDKTDIFALGCTIFEMLTLDSPHLHLVEEPEDDDESVDDTAYEEALGSRPELPESAESLIEDPSYEKIFALFFACTSENPDERPSAQTILEILDEKD